MAVELRFVVQIETEIQVYDVARLFLLDLSVVRSNAKSAVQLIILFNTRNTYGEEKNHELRMWPGIIKVLE
jgi:hypothetical protein